MFHFIKKVFSPLGSKLRSLFAKKIDEGTLDELEQLLYEADLGANVAMEMREKVKKFAKSDTETRAILEFMKRELLAVFPERVEPKMSHPHVILMVGVNGSGKTTSLAKLASHYQKMGKKVLVAAGDTFRAAASEQLATWAKKTGALFVQSQSGADPSAVAFDALASAIAKGIDVVLIDTAGRLQTKTDLMHELAKIRKVCGKKIEGAPHETLLVLDATVGQNAVDQAKTFHQFAEVTGVILTKLDGSAKGGIAVPLQKECKLPILWIGTGEKEGDLAPFDKEEYVKTLLGM